MKKIILLLVYCYLWSAGVFAQYGFKSFVPLAPVALSESTKDKPQSKIWKYAGKWWCVLSGSNGTSIFRLDENTWVEKLKLNPKNSKPDCRVDGDLVHILFFKGEGNNSFLYTVKYDNANGTYMLWPGRTSASAIRFPAGANTATLAIDNTHRIWAASNQNTKMLAWYSDAPYTSWTGPIVIATGTGETDICAITCMAPQNKIGIIWSNQIKKRFGFKTHSDGADPNTWSDDEVPASQSAIPGAGGGMADDHLNIKVASDGTIYCATKTDYNIAGMPKIILLVRRPSGSWENVYAVTNDFEGTQPIVLLNEEKGRLKVVYTTSENGGDIVYRESSLSSISFGPALTLIKHQGVKYDFVSSACQNYTSDIVLLATNTSANPLQAVGVRASDDEMLSAPNPIVDGGITSSPNPFGSTTNISFIVKEGGGYYLELYDLKGINRGIILKGLAQPGVINNVTFNGSALANGMYFILLQSKESRQTIRLVKNN